MLKQSLFILFFNFCWAIDVKLKIGENYLESRQFDYLKNFQQRIKCFLWYRIGDNEDIISGEFDKNIYLFKDVPKQIYEKEDTEEKEKLKDAEFRCEYEKHSILSEIIPWKKHGKFHRKLFNVHSKDVKYENLENIIYQISILGNKSFIPKKMEIKVKQIDKIDENINIYRKMNLSNKLKEIDLKARKAELMEKMPEDYFDRKQSLLAEIKKEYTKIIQTEKFIFRLGIKEANWLLVEIAYLIFNLNYYITNFEDKFFLFINENTEFIKTIDMLVTKYKKFNALLEIGKENLFKIVEKEGNNLLALEETSNKKEIHLNNLTTLLNMRILLELYKKLSLKLGYFNLEYDEQINTIIDKIQFCSINNHGEYLNPSGKNLDQKNEEMIKYEIKVNEIVKNFIEGRIEVEIIKVSVEEGFQYIGYDIKKVKDLGFKSEVLTDEERIKRAKIIKLFCSVSKYYGIEADVANQLKLSPQYVFKTIKLFEKYGTLEGYIKNKRSSRYCEQF